MNIGQLSTDPVPTKSGRTKWIFIIIILIIGGGIFAYTKYMSDKTKNSVSIQTDSTYTDVQTKLVSENPATKEVTSQEKIEMQVAFTEVSNLAKNGDIERFKLYMAKASPEELIVLDEPVHDAQSLKRLYEVAFKDLVEKKLLDEKVAYIRGVFIDDTEYLEMIVTGKISTYPKESIYVTYAHDFAYADGVLYWVGFEYLSGKANI